MQASREQQQEDDVADQLREEKGPAPGEQASEVSTTSAQAAMAPLSKESSRALSQRASPRTALSRTAAAGAMSSRSATTREGCSEPLASVDLTAFRLSHLDGEYDPVVDRGR